MKTFVLDASVSVAWIIPEPQSEYAEQVREELLRGAKALVPAIWPVEMASSLIRAARRGVIREEAAERALDRLQLLIFRAIHVDDNREQMRMLFDLAREHRISAYDGCYFELAHREKVPLATLDRALRSAAEQAGVAVL